MTAVPGPQPPPFAVEVRPDRDTVVVAPRGELDLVTLPELAGGVRELREVGFTRLRLDLRRLTFLDSAGLRFVLELAAQRADGLELTVVPGPPAVHRLFELTSTEQLVPFTARPRPPGRLRGGR